MRGMRLVAQRVQKQNVEVSQLLQRFGRNIAVIGQIGGRSETETKNRSIAVDHCQRLEARSEQFDRAVDRMKVDLWQSAKLIRWLEDVAKHVAQEFAGLRRGIKRKFAWYVLIRQRSQVVDSEDVVGVRVSVEHGIELSDLLAQRLFAKVRRGVDQDMAGIVVRITVADHHRGTCSAVARVRRTADGAVAANRWYAHRCAAA